ncbi:MAG TPA: phosphoglycolate phosphatase [Paracoccus sp. (in: a-proteobacteria)]|nr:phosphoglycolate phosphatase [Paracoccus sp. (in: a-proteobacteria)]
MAVPIVFDLDGTLIDSAPDIHAAVNAVLRDLGIVPLSLSRVRSFMGGGVDVLWQKIVADRGLDPQGSPALVAAFMTRYQRATSLTSLLPGVTEALGALADAGHPLGICTNKPMLPTLAILDHFGLRQLFAQVIGGDSLPQRKPAPEPLWAALRALGDDPAQPAGFFVGDSEYDAACAAAADVPLLLFTRGYRLTAVERLPHRLAFDDFAALPALVARLTGKAAAPAGIP